MFKDFEFKRDKPYIISVNGSVLNVFYVERFYKFKDEYSARFVSVDNSKEYLVNMSKIDYVGAEVSK